jgi:hypothetical protein
MCGWLSYTSQKHSASGGNEADLLGMVVSGIGSGLKLGLKALAAKQTRKYFSLKGTHLYWYAHERSREADNNIDLKQTRGIDASGSTNPKEFYIIAAKKVYRLEGEHEQECTKWLNSLKAARDGTFQGGLEDPNDVTRYERIKVYSRITGKSMYLDYDTLLETYEERVHEVIETKLVD